MFSIESRDTTTARVRFASFLKKHITISFSSLNCQICLGPLNTQNIDTKNNLMPIENLYLMKYKFNVKLWVFLQFESRKHWPIIPA